MRVGALLAVALLISAGCGGGADDPFQRTPVRGTVNVGGKPVAHGLLRLEGQKKDDLAANVVLTVTNGKVDSEAAGLPGITAGECQVELHLYEDADGRNIVGYMWARTAKCPNPQCGAEMPMVRQSRGLSRPMGGLS